MEGLAGFGGLRWDSPARCRPASAYASISRLLSLLPTTSSMVAAAARFEIKAAQSEEPRLRLREHGAKFSFGRGSKR